MEIRTKHRPKPKGKTNRKPKENPLDETDDIDEGGIDIENEKDKANPQK